MSATEQTERVRPSAELLRFTAECPHERQSILDFALRAARELEPGSRLLDVGAGNSPYRELFEHVRYESNDWQHSPHPGARAVDHIGPAHDLPVPDCEYDAVLCTQVLEHVPNPSEVISELYRVLAPGGRLYLTVPLAWELHELPFDFYRYTPHGLAGMLSAAGFGRLDIRPRNDCFETLAQLLQNAPTMVGSYPDGRDGEREEAKAMLRAMAAKVESYVGLDSRWIFPLGYSAVAQRPPAGFAGASKDAEPDPSIDRLGARSASGLGAARRFVTLCFASDLLADPRVLAGYASRFTADDDATLAIYAPHTDPAAAGALLVALVNTLGLDSPQSPDMIGLPFPGRGDERLLAASADAVLAVRPPWGAFAGLPWAHAGTLDEIHRLARDELG
jgi:SAM-dependent methyltransferase